MFINMFLVPGRHRHDSEAYGAVKLRSGPILRIIDAFHTKCNDVHECSHLGGCRRTGGLVLTQDGGSVDEGG